MGAKQHYIPQFLLRNWSADKKNIGIYLVESDRYIVGPIRDQAQRHNLYGADQKVESLFSEQEYDVSHIVAELLKETIPLEQNDLLKIKTFIALQYCRTPAFVRYMNDTLTGLVRNIMLKTFDAKQFEEMVSSTNVYFSNPVPEQTRMIIDILTTLFDLKVCLIRNTTSKGFVIGEHPVVVLNPLLSEKRWPTRSGLGLKGAVISMPISPGYILCLYDRKTYGIIGGGRIASASDEDVELLNKCQFFNTESCIYARDLENDYKDKAIESEAFRHTVKVDVDSFTLSEREKKQGRYLIHNTILDYPFDECLSFLAYKNIFLPNCLSFSDVIRVEAEENQRQYKNSSIYKKLHPIC